MPDLTQLVVAQAQLTVKATAALVKQLWGLWSTADPSDWWNDDLLAGNAAKSASLVDSALSQVRMHQRSFSQSAFKEMSIGLTQLPPVKAGYARANVTPFEVYQRPVKQLRFLQSQGLAFDEAHMRANTRFRSLAEADLTRARMDELQSLNAANPKVIGIRRIIHPELSKSGTCGLCLVAATNFYTVEELQPIHDDEHCTTLPIIKGSDPGLKLNKQDLQEIYDAAGSSAAEDLLNTRVTVNEHGELGPILTKHGDHFRTAEEAGRPVFVRQTRDTIRAAREKERQEITAALQIAQGNYNPTKSEVGHGEALAQFRAIKNMTDRISQIDRFLKDL